MRERLVQLVMALVAVVLLLAFLSSGKNPSWNFPVWGKLPQINPVNLVWFLLGALVGALGVFLLTRRAGGFTHRTSNSTPSRQPSSSRALAGRQDGQVQQAENLEPDMPWVSLDETTTVTVEEISSIEEEVDLVLMLGRPDTAIQMLLGRIESEKKSGKCDPMVWFKLLDIYYNQNMRDHFSRLALEIRDHFNVELPTWQSRTDLASMRRGLEHFPGILKKIRDNWNRPSIRDYLRNLMQDNRQGARHGFQEDAFRDILLLSEICDELAAEKKH